MEKTGNMSDEELIAAFQSGGVPEHLDILFLRHIEKVRAVLYQMVLHHADADDLTQQVFVRVARNIGQFHGRSTFSTWLYRITMNCAKSFLLKRQRIPTDKAVELLDTQAPAGSQPDQALAYQELDTHIREAIGNLSAKLRAAIILTIIQDVPLAEAARIENCTIPTMYWRVHEARKQLKSWLQEDLS